MQLLEHAFNLILKCIFNVILFNWVLNNRDADILVIYKNDVISENGMKIPWKIWFYNNAYIVTKTNANDFIYEIFLWTILIFYIIYSNATFLWQTFWLIGESKFRTSNVWYPVANSRGSNKEKVYSYVNLQIYFHSSDFARSLSMIFFGFCYLKR